MRETKKEPNNATVIRVHKRKNYTVMCNKHLFQKDLSLKAKGLMSVFLALPDDWNYSISGLCKIGKEGKDAINSTISELKKFGYVEIERKNAEKGRFTFIYHIYEEGKKQLGEDLPCTDFPYTDEAYTDNPTTVVPTAVQPISENPQQLITNKLNTNKSNTNNQLSLIEENFTNEDLLNLYKSICVHFPQPRELTSKRIKKIALRLKEHSKKDFWEIAFKKAEKSVFIRNNNFFSFDWVIENDTNAVKLYEGRYNSKEIQEEAPTSNNGGKYSKCYG